MVPRLQSKSSKPVAILPHLLAMRLCKACEGTWSLQVLDSAIQTLDFIRPMGLWI